MQKRMVYAVNLAMALERAIGRKLLGCDGSPPLCRRTM